MIRLIASRCGCSYDENDLGEESENPFGRPALNKPSCVLSRPCIPALAALFIAAAAIPPACGGEKGGAAEPVVATEWKLNVRFTKQIREKPFTGRVTIMFSRSRREPRLEPNRLNPELFVSMDVENWKPGELLTFSSSQPGNMLAYPKPLKEMDLSGYRGQAVVRFNPYDRKIGTGAGNGYSQVVTVEEEASQSQPPPFVVDRLVSPAKFIETQWSKLHQVRSKLLSEFHHRDVSLRSAVILPAGYYDNPERRYPTVFMIPGFSGTHLEASTNSPVRERNVRGVEFLRVVLDPSCPLGHHVFADSANNGPVGTALITELVPEFDRKFRSIPEPTARFLRGHSSGGWSSLWLQINYPDYFGGTWSTAPDPVDFRDFQRINLYNPGENMYVDANSRKRPIARANGRVLLWFQDFAQMEWTLGHGGQLHSFEAVFSPRGQDGKPLLLWDRKTGVINTDVAKTWEKYDIRLLLHRNWKTLAPKLKGKLRVFMGSRDTYYLEGAAKLLKQSLAEKPPLSSPPNTPRVASRGLRAGGTEGGPVEIHRGKNHSNLVTPELQTRIHREMVEAFLKSHPDYGKK